MSPQRRSPIISTEFTWIVPAVGIVLLGILAYAAAPWVVAIAQSMSLPLIEGVGDDTRFVNRLHAVVPTATMLALIWFTAFCLVARGSSPVGWLARRGKGVGVLVLCVLAILTALHPRYITGDEPHYLVLAQSLAADFDHDLSNQLDATGIIAKHAVRGPTGTYSIHYPGEAWLLAAPVRLAGVVGAKLASAALWTALVLSSSSSLHWFAIRARLPPTKHNGWSAPCFSVCP